MIKTNKQFHALTPFNPLVIGRIGSTYGFKGWLKIFSFTNKTENIFNYYPWFTKTVGKWRIIKIEDWKRSYCGLIIKIKNIKNKELASSFTNCQIIIDAIQLPNLDNDEYYWKDLIGCQVITINGYLIGKVINLIETGSNDVLVVKKNFKDIYGTKEQLIPFIYNRVIKNVNIKNHSIEVYWDLNF